MASGFYDAGPLKQVAINLFYGWGYNFYRKENQLRADDLLIRSKVDWILGVARKSVNKAEADFRREKLPPPSREKPRPDPVAMQGAQKLERLSKAIGALQALVNNQPAPENNRMIQRHREEADTLEKLGEQDQLLIGQADFLREMVYNKTGDWLIENSDAIQEGLDAITANLQLRQRMLFPV